MLRALKRRLIKYATKIYDPVSLLKIGNKTIKAPLSHQLREIITLHPEYNFNLARIVAYVSDYQSDVKVIDIGANIGDTVAFIKNKADVPILCIDGEKKFVELLKENTKEYSNVHVCETLIGAETKDVNIQLQAGKGTAYAKESTTSSKMRTLQHILEEFTEFKDSKIIKTDTDGFDTIILRSCEQFLKSNSPILFFEFDPHLIKKNNDDALKFMDFLVSCGYQHFIFYTNIGDYLVGCSADDKEIFAQLIHYFSGRKLDLFADVCAFTSKDKPLFELISRNEIDHFRTVRNY